MNPFAVAALPLCLLAAAATAGTPDWSVRVTPYEQVYPALELSQAQRQPPKTDLAAADPMFGTGSGLISVSVHARHDGEQVRVEMQASGLDAPARVEATLAHAGREYQLRPLLSWSPARLRALATPEPSTLRLVLWRDGIESGRRDVPISLRPVSEALYFVRDGRDSVDLSWIFAAYVDERDPVVDRVLALARQSGIVENFDGYDGGSVDGVYRQVWAIWQALAAHGIRYSNLDPGIARGPRVFSQRVRLLGETWADRSANCVDGSVLIASVLQRVGLRSFLVLVPGHAFVGFYTDADSGQAAYIETTLLGAPSPTMAQLPDFAHGFDSADAQRLDITGFAAALASGRSRFARAAAKLDGRHRPDYTLIDIAEARSFGIGPIAIGRVGASPVAAAEAGDGKQAAADP